VKKTLLTGIAALLLATGTAHARDGGRHIGTWDCSGVRVELLKFQVHDYQLRIDGQFDVTPRVNIKGLKDGNITFNGKRCKQTDEPEDWVDK
jgi:hypothetical protein